MVTFASTKMSSKGQVVIPQEVREAIGLRAGARFMVLTVGSDVLLKTVVQPDIDEFKRLAAAARAHARKAGIKKSDIARVIKEVRAEKRAARK